MTSLWYNFDLEKYIIWIFEKNFSKAKKWGVNHSHTKISWKVMSIFRYAGFWRHWRHFEVIVTSLWRHFDVITIIFHLILIFRGYLVVMPSFISICPFTGLWHPAGKFTPLTESDVPNHPNGIGLKSTGHGLFMAPNTTGPRLFWLEEKAGQ